MSELAHIFEKQLRVKELASSTSSNVDTPESTPSEMSEAAGMHCGFKNLYAGVEDKYGRYKWLDTIPDDVGKPAEDADSAKWALIVRHVKVFNDPRRVLKVHSVVVQSPLLKELLGKVLKGYPGVTTTLQRLTFSGKFEPLIHRWTELKDAIAAEANPTTKEHAELLYGILEKEFKETIDEYLDLKANRVASYELLFALFQPRALVFSRQDGQDAIFKAVNTKYGRDRHGNNVYWLTCQYIDWDGSKFGTRKVNLMISEFTGTVPFSQLPVYPLDMHLKCDEIRARLLERGSRFEKLAGSHYKAYHGIGWQAGQWGTKDKFNLKGRIMIDTACWNRFNPNQAVYVTSFAQSNEAPPICNQDLDDNHGHDDSDDDDRSSSRSWSSQRTDIDSMDMPLDGAFPDSDEEPTAVALTEEQLLICASMVRGYSLTTKKWLNFFVNSVKEIEWSTSAFDSLVLPANQKELILGFTESQRKLKGSFDDVIEGKGRGIILLLCGPPGVGKTLTAESVAEEMHTPLYMMTAGDLGLDPSEVEQRLSNILEMCTKWNAVLLIDEADVFLEQRSLHELQRNELVTIFLRILEYYEGIMFLTTNRVQTFDPAFQSRIHISLDYPDLTSESRRLIWCNFLRSLQSPNTLTEMQLDRLALVEMNGRQIKNAIKTAQLLSSRKEENLSYDHIKVVLDVTQHLHKMTRETDRQRSAIFA